MIHSVFSFDNMFGSKKLAKRSIIGTRVSAPWQDGRYHTGVIQGGKTPVNGGASVFKVQFEDGVTRYVADHDIVAFGFRNINSIPLQVGQKVYLTQNGREISGLVKYNHPANSNGQDEVTILHEHAPGEVVEIVRLREDIRLMESRKSARLQDQDTDYSKMLDMNAETKRRTVSQVIEVPVASKSRRRQLDDSDMSMDDDDDEDYNTNDNHGDHGQQDDEMEVMDERMAAMVLTSLSCSPASPKFLTGGFFEKDYLRSPHSWQDSVLSSSNTSSGVQSNKSVSPSPSPPFLFGSLDEGIEVDGAAPAENSAKRRKSLSRVVFKCTWPGCNQVTETETEIETHIREDHIGPREFGESDDSDHEEEFYYSEVEIPTESDIRRPVPHRMRHSSSPGRANPYNTPCLGSSHDLGYQRRDHSYSFGTPSSMTATLRPEPSASITIPGLPSSPVKRSFSWQPHTTMAAHSLSPPSRAFKSSLFSTSSNSPKSHQSGVGKSGYQKKSRSDVKKCRKVYGMENRDSWCTQCKWKKACTRFHESH